MVSIRAYILKKLLKHIVAIILILSCSISVFFCYIYFDFKEVQIKASAHSSISQNGAKIESIKISIGEFNTHEPDEISYKGKLYDVVSYQIVKDSVLVSVWHDEKEESLNADIAAHFDNDKDVSYNASGKQLSKKQVHVTDDYKYLTTVEGIRFTKVSASLKYIYATSHLTSFCFIGVIKPPPRYTAV